VFLPYPSPAQVHHRIPPQPTPTHPPIPTLHPNHRAASRAVLQPQSCKPHCAPALIPGGPVPAITTADRVRLSAAALLKRVGLSTAAHALGQQGGVRLALGAAMRAVGVGARSG